MTAREQWEPFAEPWRATARRTGAIAVAVGVGVGLYRRQLAAVPLATLLALWVTLGGHVVEVLFRNWLRYHVDGRAAVQAVARLVYWFAGGSALYAGASATRALLTGQGPLAWPWWLGGVAFVGLELVVHAALSARGHASCFNGRG